MPPPVNYTTGYVSEKHNILLRASSNCAQKGRTNTGTKLTTYLDRHKQDSSSHAVAVRCHVHEEKQSTC